MKLVPQWPNIANFQREGWPKPSLEGEDGIMSWWSTGRVKGSQPTTGLHRITAFEDLLSVFPRPWSMMKYVFDLPRESWLITARKLFSLCDRQHALATFLGHIDCAWFQLPTSSRKQILQLSQFHRSPSSLAKEAWNGWEPVMWPHRWVTLKSKGNPMNLKGSLEKRHLVHVLRL